MDWDDLRIFLAIARKGSIRGAAQLLAVNHSTVSRRITAFEKKLGVRLFERLPTGYVMTSAAEDMFRSAARIEDEVAALDRRVYGLDTQLNGVLRVTLPEALVTKLLMPDLAAFAEAYPGIELEMVISYEEFNLTKREADVAIRITNAPPDHLVGRKLVSYKKAVYASEHYLAQHDASDYTWLGWDDDVPTPAWVKESDFPKSPIHHQVSDPSTQLAAAKAGMGLAMLPCFMADPEPDLRRIPDGKSLAGREIWILTHQDLRATARVRAFIDFMVEAFARHRPLLEGHRPQAEDAG